MKRLAFASADGVFFTADHHFGHANILRADYAGRLRPPSYTRMGGHLDGRARPRRGMRGASACLT